MRGLGVSAGSDWFAETRRSREWCGALRPIASMSDIQDLEAEFVGNLSNWSAAWGTRDESLRLRGPPRLCANPAMTDADAEACLGLGVRRGSTSPDSRFRGTDVNASSLSGPGCASV